MRRATNVDAICCPHPEQGHMSECQAYRTFTTQDSGARVQFKSGMVRDAGLGKLRADLCFDGPMFMRWAELLTRGAIKYEARQWMKADGAEEIERFRQSAVRHFLAWYYDPDTDEDHAAAVIFNINGVEYVRGNTSEAATCKHSVPGGCQFD